MLDCVWGGFGASGKVNFDGQMLFIKQLKNIVDQTTVKNGRENCPTYLHEIDEGHRI